MKFHNHLLNCYSVLKKGKTLVSKESLTVETSV